MKILIISHNPITSYHNMGKTLRNLFCECTKDELCQLYCYPTLPDIDVCSSYFRVTDMDVLRSFFSFSNVSGRRIRSDEITPDNTFFEHASDQAKYHVTQHYKRILRDVMWRCSRWNTPELKQWLAQERPDCIFVAPGDACFLYDIALVIAKQEKIPIVAYICDDYYFLTPKPLISKMRFFLLKRKMRQFFRQVSHCIYICHEMMDSYTQRFRIPGTLLMTGADNISPSIQENKQPAVITYMGNIRCNRYRSLKEVGLEIDRINQEMQTNYQLHLYDGEEDPTILTELRQAQSIRRCGFLKGEEYRQAFHSAQVLLHTEAFDEASKNLVKYSVSTKIADSLASGIPLLAYGPETVASMGHLLRNDCAITATSRETLHDALMCALFDQERRIQVTQNGLNTALTYHHKETNSKKLRDILIRISNSSVNHKTGDVN